MNNINYTKLFFTMMFSITFAILISGTIFKYWFSYEANQLMKQASLSMQQAQEKRNHERLIQNQLSEQKRQENQEKQKLINIQNQKKQRLVTAERERQKRANKTRIEVCVFWKKQYKKYKGSYEKNMMEKACK